MNASCGLIGETYCILQTQHGRQDDKQPYLSTYDAKSACPDVAGLNGQPRSRNNENSSCTAIASAEATAPEMWRLGHLAVLKYVHRGSVST